MSIETAQMAESADPPRQTAQRRSETRERKRLEAMPVWGTMDCCAYCGFTRATLQHHLGRAKAGPRPFPFPKPFAVINGNVELFDPLEIRAWWADQQGRREHRGMRLVIVQQLQDPEGIHSARRLAAALGISDQTVRRWMKALGIPTDGSPEAK